MRATRTSGRGEKRQALGGEDGEGGCPSTGRASTELKLLSTTKRTRFTISSLSSHAAIWIRSIPTYSWFKKKNVRVSAVLRILCLEDSLEISCLQAIQDKQDRYQQAESAREFEAVVDVHLVHPVR